MKAELKKEPVGGERILESLSWRYAVKKFDATRKVSAEGIGGRSNRH
jgi:hypothetical protein